jgi:ferredoxin
MTQRVAAIDDEAEHVRSYVSADPAGANLSAEEPGAHIDVRLAAGSGSDAGFEVLVSSTGQTVPVGADQSIMDALAAAGVDVPSSCREALRDPCPHTASGSGLVIASAHRSVGDKHSRRRIGPSRSY